MMFLPFRLISGRTLSRPDTTLVLGDITEQDTDAIVNAADCSLLGGTGVDGAIHAAAGPRLGQACRALGGCGIGQAKATPGFDLRARYVIHAVAPICEAAGNPRIRRSLEGLLLAAHLSSIRLADEMELASVSLPSLGAGAYGWPIATVARTAARSAAAAR